MSVINWVNIKAVIFDVDGTLYDQSKLRKKMAFSLLSYYILRPWRVKELLILHHFRKEREKNHPLAFETLEEAQYAWCAAKGNFSLESIKRVVDKWMFTYPNPLLNECTFPGAKDFFDTLKIKGIKIAIYSDYKAHDKLTAMDLSADLVVSSTDPEINRLKPDPQGILYILRQLNLSPEECLFVGDRQEKDGECASRANVKYLNVPKENFNSFNFFTLLKQQLITLKE